MTADTRGWWRRRKADLSDVNPWPEGFLPRLNDELEAVRRRNRRVVRPERRRLLRKAAES
jgi:hypothetical protein